MAGYNVFISWSGNQSKAVATALHRWLPMIVQAAKPWMSDRDLDKGTIGLDGVSKALEGMKLGIVCLTPDNLESTWIHYEAGALTKTVDPNTRLWTYLFGGLENSQIKPPIGRFQHTKAEKEDTRRLVHSINNAVLDEPVDQARLDQLFELAWPQLETSLDAIPPDVNPGLPKRKVDDMVAEILEWTREQTRRSSFAITEEMSDRLAILLGRNNKARVRSSEPHSASARLSEIGERMTRVGSGMAFDRPVLTVLGTEPEDYDQLDVRPADDESGGSRTPRGT